MASHLTLEERDRLAQFLHQGLEQKEIASILGRSTSTICRELQRNPTGKEYLAGQAQQHAERRRSERPLSRRMDDPEINESVRSGLAQQWSPEQIEGRLKQQHPDDPGRGISAQTIYNWIEDDDDDREHWQAMLRRRGKRPCRRKQAETGDAARIADRPEVIEGRFRLGDFEGDTVLGPPGTGGLVTLVDRKSRFTIILKIQSKDAN